MSYLDTSAIVALLTGETSAARIRFWLNNHKPKPLMISEWSFTELSSALSLKLRTDQITVKACEAAQTQFRLLAKNSFEVCPSRNSIFMKRLDIVTGTISRFAPATPCIWQSPSRQNQN